VTSIGILLIFDEVITGFGRLGASFATEYFGVVPDMVAVAKGITNGTVPMGAVFVRKGIYDTFMDAAAEMRSNCSTATPILGIPSLVRRQWQPLMCMKKKGCLPMRIIWQLTGKTAFIPSKAYLMSSICGIWDW
jgi:hypothetical protein